MKKLLSLTLASALLIAPVTANANLSTPGAENQGETKTSENQTEILKNNFVEEESIVLEDGSNLNLGLEYENNYTIVTTEHEGIISEVKLNNLDNSMTVTEIYPDQTVKHYGEDEMQEFAKFKEHEGSLSNLNDNTQQNIITPFSATTNLINLGSSPSNASGQWQITANFDLEISGLKQLAFATFAGILAAGAIKKLTKQAELSTKLSGALIAASSLVSAFFASVKITSNSTYVAYYHYKDINPQAPYIAFWRTHMIFFSDMLYKKRIKTIGYHWGISKSF